jgi:uncharacterized protein
MKIYIPILLFLLVSCVSNGDAQKKENTDIKDTLQVKIEHDEGLIKDLSLLSDSIIKVIEHAKWQTTQQVTYDASYFNISYPNGDVPANIGVCTDVIIRAYRAVNIDLQKLVHEDIKTNRGRYGNPILDANINHRRCRTLIPFLKKHATSLPVSDLEEDYKPGDIIFWDIANGHVGLVIDEKVPNTNRYYIVHNIGSGPQKEDVLFIAEIVGHFNYAPW